MIHDSCQLPFFGGASTNSAEVAVAFKSHRAAAILCAIGALLLMTSTLNAQTDPAAGIQLFSTNKLGLDLASDNINLTIPIRNKIGKPAFSASFIINNQAYLVLPTKWGVSTLSPLSIAPGVTLSWSTVELHQTCPSEEETNFVISDATGASHPVPNAGIDLPCNGFSPGNGSWSTSDGSGYVMVSHGTAVTIYAPDGIENVLDGATPTLISDPDASSISYNPSSGIWTDSLNVAALSYSSTLTNCSNSPTYGYTYLGGNGSTSEYCVSVPASGDNIVTAFGCSGVADVDTTGFPLTSLQTPTGTYGFSYEPTPGKGAGYYTGRLASVTFPTGGSISYAYSDSTGHNGINCTSGVVPTLNVTLNDNNGNIQTWKYVNNNSNASAACAPGVGPCNYTVIETDPANNQTVYNFAGEYQTQVSYYQGGCPTSITGCSGGGALLSTVITCYNAMFTSCVTPSKVPSLPVSQTDVYRSYNGGQNSLIETKLDTYGNETEVRKYDFGAAMPPSGNPVSDTLTYYGQSWNGTSCTAYSSGTYINNTPCYTYTENSAGATLASTQITYSNTGHPTSITRSTGGSSPLANTATYNTNGTIATATDANNAVSTYAYNGTDGCNGILPTSVTLTGNGLPAGGLTTSTQWDCNGGVAIQVSDANNQPNNYSYNDPLWRITAMTDALKYTTNYTYPTSVTSESALNFNGSVSTVDNLAISDGLGRPIFGQRRQNQGSTTFDSIQTSYGWASATNGVCTSQGPFTTGACKVQSMPYSAAADTGAPTGTHVTTTQTDALGRQLTITDGGGGTVSYAYMGADVLETVGPTQTFMKQLEYDGLGRLTSVCEITSASGSGTCGQSNPQQGYWTRYQYDALGNLTAVCQNTTVPLSINCATSPSANQQTRTYAYDGLSRLTSESNPESNAITYTYDTDSTCGTSKGDLVKKIDADSNATCFAYDGLHRVTGRTYPSGPYATVTPAKTFVYDSTTFSCASPNINVAGRLTEAYTGPSSAKITDIAYCYSPRGEITDAFESTPHSAGTYHTTAGYWANGTLNTLSGVPQLSSWAFGVDGEGRPFSATYGTTTNWVTGTTYYPSQSQTTVTFGTGDTDVYGYDLTTGRMNQSIFTVGATPKTLTVTPSWNANGTLGTLGVTDQFNASNTQSCSYSYDGLARVSGVNCMNASTTVWNQSFTLDPFGNISKSGSSSFLANYVLANGTTNNQEVTVSSCAPKYDVNGNQTNDCTNNDAYAWDADGNATVLNGVDLTYDAFDRRVEIASGTTYSQILFSPIGRLALMGGQNGKTIRVPLPGGSTAEMLAGGSTHILHSDWLGSSRLSTGYSGRSMVYDAAYAPYGETYAPSGSSTVDQDFTGQFQDTLSGLYDFLYREYSPVQGRWLSPDPAGLSAVDPTNPQSWNRYVYVLNHPLSYIDPSGLVCYPIEIAHGLCGKLLGPEFGSNWDEFYFLDGYWWDGENWHIVGFLDAALFASEGGGANNLSQKEANAINSCIKQLYSINTRNFVPIQPGSNGYFYGLDANGNGITVETDVSHSSWYLGLAIFPPEGPQGGRTPLSTSPSQTNYVANDPTLMAGQGLIQPPQVHELAHSLDMITSGSIFGSSETSADRLMNCINQSLKSH